MNKWTKRVLSELKVDADGYFIDESLDEVGLEESQWYLDQTGFDGYDDDDDDFESNWNAYANQHGE